MGTQQDRAKALANGVAAEPNDDGVLYKQCQRNHGARLGLHVLDGCCRFTASGREGDALLICVACKCHRNFHKRVVCEYSDESDIPAPPTPPAAGDRR
jgi:ZF-HD homeobox protein with Cys/His-rich dimerization domain